VNQPAASDWQLNEPVLCKIIVSQRSEDCIYGAAARLPMRGQAGRGTPWNAARGTACSGYDTDAISSEHMLRCAVAAVSVVAFSYPPVLAGDAGMGTLAQAAASALAAAVGTGSSPVAFQTKSSKYGLYMMTRRPAPVPCKSTSIEL
jgi:hypothetical protein